jgi:hypothetical protein
VSITEKRQDIIDHGEAGPKDQHGVITDNAHAGRGHPGIEMTGRTGSGVVPSCENDDIADMASAVIEHCYDVGLPFADANAGAL